LIERAEAANKWSEAWRLSLELCKAKPDPSSIAILDRVAPKYVDFLMLQKDRATPRTVIEKLSTFPASPERWLSILRLWARLGDSDQVEAGLPKLADHSAMCLAARAHVADTIIQQSVLGKRQPPEAYRVGTEAIRAAFAHYEVGNDVAMNEVLATIGMRSPFSEWKLMLRGLAAFSVQDDPRAIENWSRLAPDRYPARMIAPIRQRIDPTYQGSLDATVKQSLARKADFLCPSDGLASSLRSIEAKVKPDKPLKSVLDELAKLLPVIRTRMPELVVRLNQAVYALLTRGGIPEDLRRHEKSFGPLPIDPKYNRLKAIIGESIDELGMVHGSWLAYIDEIPRIEVIGPPEVRRQAQAILLERLSNKLIEEEGDGPSDEVRGMFGVFGLDFDQENIPPLEPNPETMLRRASKLTPERIEPRFALMTLLLSTGKEKEAFAEGLIISEAFPDHLGTAELMADLALTHAPSKAMEYANRAYQLNPLDSTQERRRIQATLIEARNGLRLLEYDRVQKMLTDLPSVTNEFQLPLAALQAWIEPLRTRALKTIPPVPVTLWPDSEAAWIFALATELNRIELPKKLRAEIDKRLTALWKAPLNMIQILRLGTTIQAYRVIDGDLASLKTAEKHFRAILKESFSRSMTLDERISMGWQVMIFCIAKECKDFLKTFTGPAKKRIEYDLLSVLSEMTGKFASRAFKIGMKLRQLKPRIAKLTDDENGPGLRMIVESIEHRLTEVAPHALDDPFGWMDK